MDLNEQQKAAATYSGDAKNILVTAGAGCGKTRTIIARAAHLIQSGTDASRILMMTFTNRAAKEIRLRLASEVGAASHQVQAGTFHSFCLKRMQKRPKSFELSGVNVIDADDQKALMTLVRKRHTKKWEKETIRAFPKVSALIKYYSYSRNTCQNPEAYLSEHTDFDDEQTMDECCEIFSKYQEEKAAKGYFDFDDLLEHFSKTLTEKPELAEAIAQTFDEVLVDEMQDTNPLQFDILKHFSSQGVRLFCVGDPAQSIYRFRGAEFRHIYTFKEIFSNSEVIKLSLNYRSYQEILDFSNWLLTRSPKDYSNPLQAHRGSCGELPTLADFDNKEEEAGWIAKKILERRQADVPLKDIMALFRSSFDARPLELECIRRKIPYYFVGGMKLTQSAHVRDVLSLLRVVHNEKDILSWMRFLQLWPSIGEKTAEKLIDGFDGKSDAEPLKILSESLGAGHGAVVACEQVRLCRSPTALCVAEAVERLTPVLREHYDKWDRREQELKSLVFLAKKYKELSSFIEDLILDPITSTEVEKLEVEDAVLLITVHSAKGTEAPICFVANAGQGIYPHSRSLGNLDAEEEERRVLYVALTRAKNELFVTRSADRGNFYMQSKPTAGESYFLEEPPEGMLTQEIYSQNPRAMGKSSLLKDIYY